jgi:DDE superfamily endonuclease
VSTKSGQAHYTPAHLVADGKSDPSFRTKLAMAVDAGIPFRAVVADCFYGADHGVQQSIRELGKGYVLALKPSHAWWHAAGTIGSLQDAAEAAGWEGSTAPGAWERIERAFRDGHTERWWALEVDSGPYGPDKPLRAIVATTDPATLPEHSTWYLTTTLPALGSERAGETVALPPADLAEIVRLYGLRNWVEQSDKQTKGAMGWSDYQVRSDTAIRRHWALVCCAFSFCWYHPSRAGKSGDQRVTTKLRAVKTSEGEKIRSTSAGLRPRLSWPAALCAVRAWLEPWIVLGRY